MDGTPFMDLLLNTIAHPAFPFHYHASFPLEERETLASWSIQLVDSVPLLKAINRVRMYHAMIHLSDITSAARISMNSAMITYSQHATYYLSLQPGDMQWSCCSIRMGLVC